MILMHFLIVAGVAVVAVGAAALTGDSPKPGDLTLVQVGMALLVASWAVLLLWGLLSLLPSQCQWSGNPGFSTGTTVSASLSLQTYGKNLTDVDLATLRYPGIPSLHRSPSPLHPHRRMHAEARFESNYRVTSCPRCARFSSGADRDTYLYRSGLVDTTCRAL